MPICTPPPGSRIASLETIDFGRLIDKDKAEQLKLLALCVKDGFFYLNLQSPSISRILSDKEKVVRMMEAYFALPLDEKMKDDRGTQPWVSSSEFLEIRNETHLNEKDTSLQGYSLASKKVLETAMKR